MKLKKLSNVAIETGFPCISTSKEGEGGGGLFDIMALGVDIYSVEGVY